MRKYKALVGTMIAVLALFAAMALAGCDDKADVASENISKACDNFECVRTIRLVNVITDSEFTTIEGRCNIEHEDEGNYDQLEVTCLNGDDTYAKHYLGLTDNVTYVVEQETGIDVSDAQYRVTFAPKTVIPDIHTP